MPEYVIIGSGIAAISAAKTIRKKDADGEIAVISREKEFPYYRMNLTKILETGEAVDKLYIDKEEFYTEKKINLRLGIEVKDINFDGKEIKCSNGEVISYNKLLIATGSNPFVPHYESDGQNNIFVMRTIDDLNKVREALKSVKSAVIVGGGLLGLEAAYAIKKQGIEVHICEFAPKLLTKQLDAEMSDLLGTELNKDGFKIHTGASLTNVVGNGIVEKAVLSNGEEISCQMVLFSVGIKPETSLAKKPVEVNRGILVNTKLETNCKNVWAAGDCAEINGMTMGLWTASNEMGKIAGENMTGGDLEYNLPKLFTNLSIGNIKLFSAGVHDDAEEYKLETENGIIKLFFKDGKTVGGILYQDVSKRMILNKLIFEKADKEEAVKKFSE